jgi:alkylated DNA nucleotide flippase Atl1
MGARTKSWQEKLAAAYAKTDLPKTFRCDRSGKSMVVPHPRQVERLMRALPRGRLATVGQFCQALAQAHRVEVACPITTGIFAWIIAHAQHERSPAPARGAVPWWRLLKTGGMANAKYPGAGARQLKLLAAEGHRTATVGKRLTIAGYEQALVSQSALVRALGAGQRKQGRAARAIERAVIEHDKLGLCVLLPKTSWGDWPAKGAAIAMIDGKPVRCRVLVEQCNCRGTGMHEHRFLGLPGGAAIRGQRVRVQVACAGA